MVETRPAARAPGPTQALFPEANRRRRRRRLLVAGALVCSLALIAGLTALAGGLGGSSTHPVLVPVTAAGGAAPPLRSRPRRPVARPHRASLCRTDLTPLLKSQPVATRSKSLLPCITGLDIPYSRSTPPTP